MRDGRWQVFSFWLFLGFMLCGSAARADSYQAIALDSSSGDRQLIGITDDGTVVTTAPICAVGSGYLDPCYLIYALGQPEVESETLPNLTFDNGGGCTAVVNAGFSQPPSHAVCNGSKEIFADNIANSPYGLYERLFDGPDPSDQVATNYIDTPILLDAKGDFVFDQFGVADVDTLYLDLTSRETPEPSSLVLLASGGLAMAGAVRRKFVRGGLSA